MPTETFLNLPPKKRELIITYALKEFSTKPFTEASVNTIVKNAGISKGSLYQYFKDKTDLYLYILDIAGQRKLLYLEECQRNVKNDDFFEKITSLMMEGCRFDLENPLFSQLLYQALTGPLVDVSIEQMKSMNRKYMQQMLCQAIEHRQIREDVALDMLVFFLSTLTIEFAKHIAQKAEVKDFKDIYTSKELESIKTMDYASLITDWVKLIRSALLPETKE